MEFPYWLWGALDLVSDVIVEGGPCIGALSLETNAELSMMVSVSLL